MVTTFFITVITMIFVFSTMMLMPSPNQVKEAVILGHDGNVWAASQDFSVSSKAVSCLICLGVLFIVFLLTKVNPSIS